MTVRRAMKVTQFKFAMIAMTLFLPIFGYAEDLDFLNDCNRIGAGSRVLDYKSKNVGTVIAVFNNGKSKVQFDGYGNFTDRDVDKLSLSISCMNGICVGNRVLDYESKNLGTIKMVFDNGKSKVQFNGYGNFADRDVDKLSVSPVIEYSGDRDCLKNNSGSEVCVGSQVLDYKSKNVGTVKVVFNNGKSKVQFDGYGNFADRDANRLSLSISCMDGICVGHRVLD